MRAAFSGARHNLEDGVKRMLLRDFRHDMVGVLRRCVAVGGDGVDVEEFVHTGADVVVAADLRG